MDDFEKQQAEIEALCDKLEALFDEFDRQPKPKAITAAEILYRARAAAFCPEGSEEHKRLEAEEKAREAELNPTITLSVTPVELLYLIQSLIAYRQSLVAQRYIKQNVGTDISSAKRWETVAELTLLKEPRKKLEKYDDSCLIEYSVLIKYMDTRAAVAELYRKHRFPSEEACRKWLCRKIDEWNRDYGSIIEEDHPLFDLPKPVSWPQCNRDK
ncbi:MAG: hypothetical protein Kow0065_13630 [Methylomicrobium sp.]